MNHATMQQIAEVVGVSKMTVSRSLRGIGRVSDTTRERVRRAARQLGYPISSDCILGQPAHRGSSDHNLRVLVPTLSQSRAEVSERIGAEIMRGLGDRLALNEGRIEHASYRSLEDLLAVWEKSRANGIVLRRRLPVSWVAALEEFGPVVCAASMDYYPAIDAVYTNEMRSAVCLQRRLRQLGHQRVAWLGIYDVHAAGELPADEYHDLGHEERCRLSIHGSRYAAWTFVATVAGQMQPTLFLYRDWEEESLDETVQRSLARIRELDSPPTVIVVPTAPMASSLHRLKPASGLSPFPDVVCYSDVPHVFADGTSCATVVLPMYDVGRAIPDLIERRMAAPDAAPLTLMFEAALHPGATLASVNQPNAWRNP